MKNKKAPAQNVYVPPEARVLREGRTPAWLVPLLTAALFFFYAFLCDVGMEGAVTAKVLTLCLCVGLAALLFTRKAAAMLKERITLPALAVSGYVLVCGISTFYAVSGKFAIKEYSVMLCSFALFLLLTAAGKGGAATVRNTAAVIAGALGLFSLISIDSASLGWISRAFKVIISPFTSLFENYGGFETGTRIVSIFQNPNIYAGTTALGILLGLYLVLGETSRKRRMFHLAVLSVNALGFLLAFSMGGTAMFALSIAVYLIAAGKGKRIPAFVLMLETSVPTLIMAIISYAGLGKEGIITAVPMLAAVVNAVLLILLDRFVGEKLSGFLQTKGRISAVCIGSLALLLVSYIVLGFFLTASYHFSDGETLRRSAYPPAGEYTVTVQSDKPFSLMIESQNIAQTQLHTSTVLYQGEAKGAFFTVPEDAEVVYFNFTAPESGVLESAAFSDGETVRELPLKYLLFPGFVANRLQGLMANENAIQRLVFFRDGLRVFARSPIAGSGLGSFENSLFGVQDFYYTTKYVHNHYIQSLADTGIIGFLFFAGSIVLLAFSLFQNRKTENACFPALCACLTMVAGHSMVEVSFSAETFQPTAFLIFALISMSFSKPILKKPLQEGYRLGAAALLSVFALLLSGNLLGKLMRSEGTFDGLESSAKIDFYEKNDSKLSYVMASTGVENANIQEQAALYARDLRKAKSNSISNYLVQYYIQTGRYDDMFDCMEEGLSYTKSSASSWQTQFTNLEYAFSKRYNPTYEILMEKREQYVERALAVYENLVKLNKVQMDQITLLPRNNMLIGNLLAVRELASQEEIDALLENKLFSLEHFADVDENGLPDAASTTAGSIAPNGQGFCATSGTVLQLQLFHDLEGTYQIRIKCDPASVSSLAIAEQPVPFTADAEGITALVSLAENMEAQPLTVSIAFQTDADVASLSMDLLPS